MEVERGRAAPRVRWIAVVLFLVVVGALVPVLPASARLPVDSIELVPLPEVDPPFRAPADGFNWFVPGRIRFDAWNELGGEETPLGLVETYDATYVHPLKFPMNFIGCPNEEEADRNAAGEATAWTYVWEVAGETQSEQRCTYRHVFDAEGTYPAQLTILDGDTTVASHSQVVEVEDLLIVSLGDSYASGEGNPDVTQIPGMFWPERKADWLDDRCHRSASSGPAQAALALERADRKTSVTFLSFACSGATIDTEYFTDGDPLDPYGPASGDSIGTGILGSYAGAAPPDGEVTNRVPSQIEQLRRAITVVNADGQPVMREVDALTVSGGGNDIGFGPIATICVLYGPSCPDKLVGAPDGGKKIPLRERFGHDVSTMAGKYAALAAELNDLPIAEVFVTEYPDPTTDEDGLTCGRILEDVIPQTSPWVSTFSPFLEWLGVSNGEPFHIEGDEVEWARTTVLPELNRVVRDAATAHGWTYVGGISEEFIGHGYCSSDSWIRRAADSTLMQGPHPSIVNESTKGTLHPTVQGHSIYARRIVEEVSAKLSVGTPSEVAPPAFTATTTGTAGADGWLVGPAAVTVEAQASGEVGQNGIGSTRLSVNGPGCDQGLACTATEVDDRTYRWTFEASASGVYRLNLVAADWWEATSTNSHEFKVDLDDPTASVTVSSEGGPPSHGWYREPVNVRIEAADAANGSGVGVIEYQLDGAAPVSAPHGTEVTINSDGVHSVRYRARDRAGRTSPWEDVEIAIDTTAPVVSCESADGRWHNADVTLSCTAVDAASGLSNAGDASIALSTAVAGGVETAHAATSTRTVCDEAGNCATAGPVGGNRVDRRAPQLTVRLPEDRAVYTLGSVHGVAYSCVDGGSGVAGCSGTVANGSTLDTSAPGRFQFGLDGTDIVGNSATVLSDYGVSYGICPLYDEARALGRPGATVPIRLALCNADGGNVSDPDVVLTAVDLDGASLSGGRGVGTNVDGAFRYDSDLGGYVFNLGTEGLTSGIHTLTFKAQGDPHPHRITFILR